MGHMDESARRRVPVGKLHNVRQEVVVVHDNLLTAVQLQASFSTGLVAWIWAPTTVMMAAMPDQRHRAAGIEKHCLGIGPGWVIASEHLPRVMDDVNPERAVLEAKLSLAIREVKQTVEYPIK